MIVLTLLKVVILINVIKWLFLWFLHSESNWIAQSKQGMDVLWEWSVNSQSSFLLKAYSLKVDLLNSKTEGATVEGRNFPRVGILILYSTFQMPPKINKHKCNEKYRSKLQCCVALSRVNLNLMKERFEQR